MNERHEPPKQAVADGGASQARAQSASSDMEQDKSGGTKAPPLARKESTRKRTIILIGGVALIMLAATGGIIYWLHARNYESTDDAFIESNVVQISPKISGHVGKVHVVDNQRVAAGALLVDIDPRDYEARLNQAKASLNAALARQQAANSDLDLTRVTSDAGVEQGSSGVRLARSAVAQARAQAAAAEAEAVRAEADVKRYRELFAKDAVSRQRLDQAVADARSAAARAQAANKGIAAAEAQVGQSIAKLSDANSAPQQIAAKQAQVARSEAEVEQARAALVQAELDLSYAGIRAREAGQVTKKNVDPGQLVQVGQVLMALVYGEVWVTANFKETQLTRMRVGQPVEIKVDAYPDRVFRGHVDSFQSGTGSRFSLLPPENATGNYVKVVQRLPVKIVFDEQPDSLRALAPGMSVEPTVDISAASETQHAEADARRPGNLGIGNEKPGAASPAKPQ